MGVDAFAGGDSMGGCGHEVLSARPISKNTAPRWLRAISDAEAAHNVIVHNDGEDQQQEHHADGDEALLHATLRSRRMVPSMKSIRMWPPSSGGIGRRFRTAKIHADHR